LVKVRNRSRFGQFYQKSKYFMEISSPLTGKSDVTEIERFPIARISKIYKEEFALDVNNYFKGLDYISLYECNETGYRFYFPLSLEADSCFYESLMAKHKAYYPQWRWENEVALQFIKDGHKVLDVGCGDGVFLRGLLGKRKVVAEGLELNKKALAKAMELGLTVYDQTVQEYAEKNEGQYDIITSFQVLEHIADVKSFLQAKVSLIKPGGIMMIGIPYNNPYLYRKDKYHTLNLPPHHMGLWGKASLMNLGKIFNLEIKDYKIERVDDIVYYAFVQMGKVDKYKSLIERSKPFRFLVKCINKIGRPPSSLLKGRNIVMVFKKNDLQ
jgi:SAM-dependent methyltransferase